MHRRYDSTNIPIELLRSFVAIAELGSLTKAAERLKVTQPAVSAQVKRLQQIVGSELLEKSGFGLRVSGEGEVILRYARRLLALNDQILLHSAAQEDERRTRIGLSPILTASMLGRLLRDLETVGPLMDFHIHSARAAELAERFVKGHLDVVAIPVLGTLKQLPRVSWSCPMTWVGTPRSPVSPTSPVPLIGWHGSASEKISMDALHHIGRPYRFNFVAEDWATFTAAVNAGLGHAAVLESIAAETFKPSREHYLPPLPDLLYGIFVRPGFDEKVEAVVRVLENMLAVTRKVETRTVA